MIRHFGVAAYAEVMMWPWRLIVRAVQVQREADAEVRLARLADASMADSMELGRRYVDPAHPPQPGGAHYDLSAYQRHQDALARQARPWEYTEAAVRRRREAEEERDWDNYAKAIGGARA